MPTYVYKNCITGEVIELHMPVCEMQKRQRADGTIRLDDGTIGQRVYTAPRGRMGKPRVRQGYPHLSYSMAVAPDQVPETREKLKKSGVSCDFDEGRPVITSRTHLRKVSKALGFHENSSYV